MKPEEELDIIMDKARQVVDTEFTNFYSALIVGTPVDGGLLKGDWFQYKIDIGNTYKYVATNNMEYSPIIWAGRQTVNGKAYGSYQGWGLEGGQVFVDRYEKILQGRLNAI